MEKSDIKKRVDELIELVGLSGMSKDTLASYQADRGRE